MKRKFVTYLIIAGAIGVVGVGYGVPYYYTTSAERCATCKTMSPYYDSWKSSVHETAASDCTYCHVRRGFFNHAVYRVFFWQEIVAQATGREMKPPKSMLPVTDSCSRSRCHSLNRTVNPRGDLKINHREHVLRAEATCIDCHPGTVHAGVGGIPPAKPARESCTECHDDRMGECAYCHTEPKRLKLDFEH